MKTKKLIPIILVMLLFSGSCKKEDNNPYGKGNGQTTFWIMQDAARWGYIDVTVDNQSVGTITHYYLASDALNICGNADLNITKPAGDHNFSATSRKGGSWSGTVTFDEGKCNPIQLNATYNCASFSLDGTWTRQEDAGCVNCTGMVISFSGGQGIIQSVPGNNDSGYLAGQIKWKNYASNNCAIDNYYMPSATYINEVVYFLSSDSVKINGVLYKK